jgi:hypothetical protein
MHAVNVEFSLVCRLHTPSVVVLLHSRALVRAIYARHQDHVLHSTPLQRIALAASLISWAGWLASLQWHYLLLHLSRRPFDLRGPSTLQMHVPSRV